MVNQIHFLICGRIYGKNVTTQKEIKTNTGNGIFRQKCPSSENNGTVEQK
jgi:hypothetical protein